MSRIKMIVALLAGCTTVGLAQNSADAQSQVQPPRPSRIRVSGGVMLGLVEHKAMPEYPEEAMTKGIQGDVIFKITVDETGKIVLSVPVEGDPLLVAASVDALRDFHFRPYLLNGAAIRVESQLGFHFSLEGKGVETKGRVDCMSSIPDRPEFRTGVVNDKGALVLDPRKVSSVEPQLPPELAGKSGSVYLTITIGADGKVQDVKVVGGDEPFISPVVAAVKQYVYEPQLVDGKPSVATTQASYHFGPRH
ncbi:MAG: energy transducer TonB [Terriglobales bacterium]